MFSRVLKEYGEVLVQQDTVARAEEPGPKRDFTKGRVFIVDDEPGICKFIAHVLADQGFESDPFASAPSAVRALKHCTPEIIFLDIALEGSDAIDVLRKLGETGYRGVVQLMSGSNQSMLEDVRRVGERHNLNMRSPLRKPFRSEAIRNLVAINPGETIPAGKPSAEAPPAVVRLEEALQRGWLELWYQPKLDLDAQTFIGAEGLIRCRHPTCGVLTPASFLGGAGQQTLSALTEHVISKALRDWHELAKLGFNLHLAVNASIDSLTDGNLTNLIRENRPSSDQWPGLILEVTESEVARDVSLAHEIATQLGMYGITLAIDDFGEGFSSFARLRELPFAELKLDASFVKNCAQDAKNAGICQAVIELAHNFGAAAVAEGLEDASDVRAIHRMGCDLGQGFTFARPMPSALLITVLRHRAGRE
jgi:EAL domain-containing protein (putative c-di-GMP-specific phosphodiesterase class I)